MREAIDPLDHEQRKERRGGWGREIRLGVDGGTDGGTRPETLHVG
jgi:hypothetical protein